MCFLEGEVRLELSTLISLWIFSMGIIGFLERFKGRGSGVYLVGALGGSLKG